MLAVVKLRQKGTTKVSKLPSGVFRHMLEYKYPNEFSFRYSTPYKPNSKAHDRKFPATDKLDYDNYMVGIEDSNGSEFRMILKDKSTCNTQAGNYMHSVSIQPADAVVNKIEIGYDSNGVLCGFKLYAENGAIVLQTGFDWVKNGYPTHTENLDEGERILGYISSTWLNGNADHRDFQFVIGRLV